MDQQVALITGGSRGLGLAAARGLLASGIQVAIVGRNKERLRRTCTELENEFNLTVLAIHAELGTQAVARSVVARTLDKLGRLDTVIAAAGDVPVGTLASLDDEAWRTAFEGKLFGHIALFREAEEHLRAQGSGLLIALTGSTGYEPSAANIAAGAVNAALQNAMKAIAEDLGTSRIRVLSISPGPFLTDRLRTIAGASRGQDAVSDAEVKEQFANAVPLGRIGEPWELGALIQFLSSRSADFLHGTTIVIDGGKLRTTR